MHESRRRSRTSSYVPPILVLHQLEPEVGLHDLALVARQDASAGSCAEVPLERSELRIYYLLEQLLWIAWRGLAVFVSWELQS